MKTPEEYFQEQAFSTATQNSQDFSDAEKSFLRKYMGVETGVKDSDVPLPPVASPESVMGAPAPPASTVPAFSPALSADQSISSVSESGAPAVRSQLEQLRSEDEIQFVSFIVSGQEYALPIISIQEVIKFIEPTKLPTAPHFLSGIINLRGKVTPLVSLQDVLSTSEGSAGKFIVICRHQGLQLGLIVHAVATMYRVKQESIEWNIEARLGVASNYVGGLVKSKEKLMGILAIDALVEMVLNA